MTWAITAGLVVGFLLGVLVTLASITKARRRGYMKWIADWERVEWAQAAIRYGIADRKLAGEEFMIQVQFAWKGIAARHLLEMVVRELRDRCGRDAVAKVEVLRKRGL